MIAPSSGFVRLALPAEGHSIATVQRRVWAALVPDREPGLAEAGQLMLTGVSQEEMEQGWAAAISRPPAAAYRVLVATEDDQVVGYATTMPTQDADTEPGRDGQIDELAIDPSARRRGHGSRLLHAAVDTLRADGCVRARCWIPTTDDVLRTFLTDAGWAADGSSREIGTDDDTIRLKQIRLHTALQ